MRTWREKKDKEGNAIWLRRSRLVAREYTWLQPDREALFSPATSNIASRILPICFLALREHQDTMMLAIDVKDAFLTVKQEQPTRVRCTDASGKSVSYSLGRVLPDSVMAAFCGIEISSSLLVKAPLGWRNLKLIHPSYVPNLVIAC